MLLGKRFKEEDKHRVWDYRPYCQVCGSNINCSLHHIRGCKGDNYDSIVNSIMLCNRHHKEADGFNVSDIKFQENYINITLRIIREECYEFKQRDILFIKSCVNDGMVLQ